MLEGLRNYKLLRLDIIFLVFIATIVGAILRWQLQNDFLSNLTGAAILGFVLGLNFTPRFQVIFAIGFCPSLTTFSGWIWDVMELIINGFLLRALGLLLSTLIGGFLFLSLGFWSGKKMSHFFLPQ